MPTNFQIDSILDPAHSNNESQIERLFEDDFSLEFDGLCDDVNSKFSVQ